MREDQHPQGNRQQQGQGPRAPQGQQPQPGQGPGGQQGPPPQQRPPAQQQGRQGGPQPQGQAPPRGNPQQTPPMRGQPQGGPQRASPQPPQGQGMQTQHQQQGVAGPGGPPPQAQQQQAMGPRPRLEPVTVDEIIQTDVVNIETDQTVSDAVEEMAAEDVGSAVVVEDQRPVGILTDRDVALAVGQDENLGQREAGEFIEGDPITATTDMSIFEALQRLQDDNVRRLPVVDDEGNLQGIITLDDILVLFGEKIQDATEVIEAQAPRF